MAKDTTNLALSEEKKPQDDSTIMADEDPSNTDGDMLYWAHLRAQLDTDRITVVSTGTMPIESIMTRLDELMRFERSIQDLAAGVALDPVANQLLKALDDDTSLRWDTLRDRIGMDWSDICRGVSLLSGAHLCQPGSVRVRLTERADRLLAEAEENG